MIKHLFLVGDTHGNFTSFKNLPDEYQKAETAVIILGDAGYNFNLNQHDEHRKKGFIKHNKCYVYCVKGNHCCRPSEVPGMKLVYDENVGGEVWMQDKYPTIRYFKEYGIYNICGRKVLVIGGAYSVDKWYRLQMDYPWFPSEQLTEEEMTNCYNLAAGQHFDLVLSHTCPISWEPVDLFMGGIDQSKVDKIMELWMEKLKDAITWDAWCFGHFHDDQLVRPHVEMFYNEIEDVESVLSRWKKYDETGELDWWISKSPNFYMGI